MNISEEITIKTNIKQKYKNIGVIAEYTQPSHLHASVCFEEPGI